MHCTYEHCAPQVSAKTAMPNIHAGCTAASAQANESAMCHAYSFTPFAPSNAVPQSVAIHEFLEVGLVRHAVSATSGVGNAAFEPILQHQSGTVSATLTPVPFDM